MSSSDSSLAPTASDSPPSPPSDDSSLSTVDVLDSSQNSTSTSPPPPANVEGPSSSPPSNPSTTSPPPTNLNSSAVEATPPSGEASPPPSPDPSPPPPASPPPPSASPPLSGGENASPPPAPTPPKHGPPAPSGSPPPPHSSHSPPPPPPLSPHIPAPTHNSAAVPGSEAAEKPPPPHEPTTPSPPIQNPVVISSPGATPETTIPVLAPPAQGNPTLTSDSSFHPPPTSTTATTSTRTPNNSPPSSNSKPEKPSSGATHTPSGSSTNSGTAVGVAVAGVFILALIAAIFLVSRRRKRRIDIYAAPYLPPNNFVVKSDGNYYPHQHMGNSGSADGFYTQVPHTPVGNSFGSQRGTGYSGGGASDSGVINTAQSFFSYEELMEITSGFSRQNILGEGGFGCVYKGWLPDGKPVAVKQLKAGSGQGEREFKAEVEIISRVHHRYLVSLVGYCISENHRLLIYEFVPNQTLEHHLHANNGLPVLDWAKRLKIALGAAKGLAYLHEDCHPKIIHRDIKSANILLDDAFEAQVADFGLAKLTNDTSTHVSTRVMGTFGYMAPEYASSGKLTDRSDVFSFGVVLLELVTGRKPVDPTQPLGDESLVEWARPLLIRALETGEFGELVDPRLGKQYVESEMFRMIEAAAACVRHSALKRPRMVQVVRALDTESDMSDLSNGVKYGQSTVYDSGQYNQDISRFRRMALGSDDSSDYDMYSGGFNSREMPTSRESWNFQDNSSYESETRAFNAHSGIAQNHPSSQRF